MLQVKSGSHRAFELLLKRYEKQLLSFFYRQLGDPEGAKDLTMDTFLRIYKAAGRYEPRAKFSTYIYQIARNLCINEYRKRKIRQTDSLDALGSETGLEIAEDKPDQIEVMVRQERQALVRRALAALSENQRTILILSEYQGFSYDRIAKILGCSLGTVKSRAHRARQKIKEWMEEHDM